VLKGECNQELSNRTLEGLNASRDGGLLLANFVEFDTLYGHRPASYSNALEQFDARSPELLCRFASDNLLISPPTTFATLCGAAAITREQVPVFVTAQNIVQSSGVERRNADVAQPQSRRILSLHNSARCRPLL
jgi:phosphopentomutase